MLAIDCTWSRHELADAQKGDGAGLLALYDEYFERLFTKVRPILERQLGEGEIVAATAVPDRLQRASLQLAQLHRRPMHMAVLCTTQ